MEVIIERLHYLWIKISKYIRLLVLLVRLKIESNSESTKILAFLAVYNIVVD